MSATTVLPKLDRVIKLGGSLLDWPEFPQRLRQWLAQQPPKPTGFIVGGGVMVDCLRNADRVHHLGEEAAHWLCIKAMSLTAQMVSQLLPELTLLDAEELMTLDQKTSEIPLPASWSITSDSIAARACTLLGADELVLLKSKSPPKYDTLEELATDDYVDTYFPQAARQIAKIRFVNLRAEAPTDVTPQRTV
jgi:aspartokinase-like uncharacterized kinase